MVETARDDAGDDRPEGSAGRASFEELSREPERVADAADAGPVRIDRPGRGELVLLTAAEFDRLNGRTRAMHITELSDEALERMRNYIIPDELREFDHEGGFVGHG